MKPLLIFLFVGIFSLPQSGVGGNGQSLQQAAEDPTAPLMSFQLNNWYSDGFYTLPGESANSIVLRSAIPYVLGDHGHIFRITAPIITDHPFLDSGLSDITIFDLTVFEEDWGRWGLGPVALLPTGGSLSGADRWALGPAVGFTAKKGELLYGLFNQNLLDLGGRETRSDINVSVLQPIISYGLGDGWALAASEMTYTWDWETERWSSLPLGVKLAKLTKVGSLPVQLSVQYEHDFASDAFGPEDTIRFTAKFLFPTGS